MKTSSLVGGLLTLGSCVLLPSTALAAPANGAGAIPQGTWVVSAERLAGVYHTEYGSSEGASPSGITTIALLGHSEADLIISPRLAVDAFLIDGLSLGGSATVVHSGGTGIDDQVTRYYIAPRVGFGYMFTDVIGLWPRLGVSYEHTSEDDADVPLLTHLVLFDLEAPLLIKPIKNFAIMITPSFDTSLGGSTLFDEGPGSLSQHISETAFALSCGVAGFI